jgi:TolB protein
MRSLWVAALAAASVLGLAPSAGARLPRAELAYARFDDAGHGGIRALRPRSGERRSLTTGRHLEPLWSPDKSRLAFVELNSEFRGVALWVVSRDGSDERKVVDLTTPNPDSQVDFDWSPDGTQLVYVDRESDTSSENLYRVDVSSGDVSQVTTDETKNETRPSWSPDGPSIAYQAISLEGAAEDGRLDVYKVDVGNGTVDRLTSNQWDDYEPMWSPDGASIAFFSTRDDYHSEDGPYLWEVYVMQVDGTGERRITRQATRKSDASWAPNGEKIAYNSRCDDDLCGNDYDDNIFVVDVSSRGIKRITTKGRRSEFDPTWSPNSRWVAYTISLRGGRTSDLGATRVRDRETKRLTDTADRAEGQPAWSVN